MTEEEQVRDAVKFIRSAKEHEAIIYLTELLHEAVCPDTHVLLPRELTPELWERSMSYIIQPYGYELVLDLHECNPERFTEELVKLFCHDLCDRIDMKREDFHIWASDPADYDTDPDHLHGVSAVQFITTSTLVIHTLPKMRRAYINVFSCKIFDRPGAALFATMFFDGTIAGQHYLDRK